MLINRIIKTCTVLFAVSAFVACTSTSEKLTEPQLDPSAKAKEVTEESEVKAPEVEQTAPDHKTVKPPKGKKPVKPNMKKGPKGKKPAKVKNADLDL